MSDDTTSNLGRTRFLPGACVFREGEPGSLAYLIEKGSVEISVRKSSGKEIISTLGEGEVFGEMALIDYQKRSATAVALEDTHVITLDREQFENKINSADPVLHLLLRVVLKRFRRTLREDDERKRFNMTAEFTVSGLNHIFDKARHEAIQEIRLDDELRQALAEQQFELYYQPLVSTVDKSIAGFEALIRWHHPTRGIVSPDAFISAAEGSDLIIPIGRWVMEQACSDLNKFNATRPPGSPPLFMAVNVSSRQIQDLVKDNLLSDIISNAGIAAQQLKLELTESILIDSPEVALRVLSEIKSTGVHIAIDDFGTGYSSLSYLHQFPLDVLKIDRSFISRIVNDSQSRQIVKAILGLAKELSMTVVAEGVESDDTVELLSQMGCDLLQGYLFSRPVVLQDALTQISAEDVNTCHANACLIQAEV